MIAVVAAFNQEKALVGAFSVIEQLYRLIVHSTKWYTDTGTALHPASEARIFIYEHDKASYKLTRQVDTELQIKIKICRYSD